MKLLLERGGVNPNGSSNSGETPLQLAAESGDGRFVGHRPEFPNIANN